jgi:hypothetical protein
MYGWWDRAAARLQEMGDGNYPKNDPGPDDIYRVVLHTRQDLILLVSYLSSLNRQLFQLKLLLAAAVAALVWSGFK